MFIVNRCTRGITCLCLKTLSGYCTSTPGKFTKARSFSVFTKLLQNDRKTASIPIHFLRAGTGKDARIAVDLSDEAHEALVNQNVKPKDHPGSMNIGRVELPERFVSSAKFLLSHQNLKSIEANSVALGNYLHERVLPVEEVEYREKANYVQNEVESKDSILEPFLSEEQLKSLENNRNQKIKKKLRTLIYHWKPVDYSGNTCFEYLVTRTPAEYAALCKVFHEITKRDTTFHPTSICDFGSGIGSTIWASHKFWGSTLREFLAVDASRDMGDLAELILRGGSLSNDHWLHGVFFRQFLPASTKIKYDIVVSSYSLLELSSLKQRIETVDILWKKTNTYLVLIENGTNAGFEAIIQARDYILGLHEEKRSNCHVFSPCPHDTFCPRFDLDNTPCNFTVKYKTLLPFNKDITKKEMFSYMVLKKGKRHDAGWPRVVREPLIRSKHAICRLCTKSGDLAEVVLTKRTSSTALYRCGRKCKVGDLFPVYEMESIEKDILPNKETLKEEIEEKIL